MGLSSRTPKWHDPGGLINDGVHVFFVFSLSHHTISAHQVPGFAIVHLNYYMNSLPSKIWYCRSSCLRVYSFGISLSPTPIGADDLTEDMKRLKVPVQFRLSIKGEIVQQFHHHTMGCVPRGRKYRIYSRNLAL